MMLTLNTLFVLIPPLLLIEGFFSGSELALLATDKLVLKAQAKRGSKGAELALKLATHPERVLSTTLLMTSACMVALSALIALYFISQKHEHADLVAILVTSPLVVILGELIPKTIFQRYADQLAPKVAYPVYWLYWVFYPITRPLSTYTDKLSRLIGPIEELMTGKRRSTREELRTALSIPRDETDIKTSEKRMIKRILDFKDTEAKHALIPLVRVDAIEEGSTLREALEKFKEHRHSRMPVYADRIDNIVGVLESADLGSATDLNQGIKNYVTPAHYVAETQSLEDLIMEMRREDNEMVVVVDEYGGAVGILTFEDVVEEIVGEINDEYDTDSEPFKAVGDNSWMVQSRMEISQINEQLHLALPEGDYETLAGFLLQQFGRIPEIRDELHFDTPSGSLKFTIRKATERNIELVLIDKTKTAVPND